MSHLDWLLRSRHALQQQYAYMVNKRPPQRVTDLNAADLRRMLALLDGEIAYLTEMERACRDQPLKIVVKNG